MEAHVVADAPKQLKYQPYFCEENIWHLCQHPDYLSGHVVFIASYSDYFPMLSQQGYDNPGELVFWDYHVVLLNHGNIYDFNTALPFTSKVSDYFAQSFIDDDLLNPSQAPMFRMVPADEFVAEFESDRRHMKTADGWNAPPPEWPLITQSASNLHRFADMSDLEFGQICSHSQFLSNAERHASS